MGCVDPQPTERAASLLVQVFKRADNLIDCRPQLRQQAKAGVGWRYVRVVRCNKRSPRRTSSCRIEWLKADLAATDKQTIIISHQAFDEIWDGCSVPNRHLIRKVIDDSNNRTGFQKVIACFCGHHHLDDHSYINKVHYFQMNSASYYYTGDACGSDGGKAVYQDPLYAFVTIDPAGQIKIEGKQSHFKSPTPTDTQFPDAHRISASISNRKESF